MNKAQRELKRCLDGGKTIIEIARESGIGAATLGGIQDGSVTPSTSLLEALAAVEVAGELESRSLPCAMEGGIEVCEQRIRGYAAVYYDGSPDTEYNISPTMVERIHPGAFSSILESRADMLALYHHDESQLLGRRASGSLELADESRGLKYSVPFDKTDPVHQVVAARIKRGDVQGSSFTFDVARGGQTFERRSDGKIIRNLREFSRVVDVGPTHLPTYAGTTAEFRSRRALRDLEEQAAASVGLEPPTPVEFLLALREDF